MIEMSPSCHWGRGLANGFKIITPRKIHSDAHVDGSIVVKPTGVVDIGDPRLFKTALAIAMALQAAHNARKSLAMCSSQY